MGNLARGVNLNDVVDAYEEKKKQLPAMIESLEQEVLKVKNACSMYGAFGGTVFKGELPSERHLLECLKCSAWQFVYDKANIEHIAPKTHIKHFQSLLSSPPEFDFDNLKSVFGEYVINPRAMQLKAFAEIFCNLDPYYKSHDNMKIGVKGLIRS